MFAGLALLTSILGVVFLRKSWLSKGSSPIKYIGWLALLGSYFLWRQITSIEQSIAYVLIVFSFAGLLGVLLSAWQTPIKNRRNKESRQERYVTYSQLNSIEPSKTLVKEGLPKAVFKTFVWSFLVGPVAGVAAMLCCAGFYTYSNYHATDQASNLVLTMFMLSFVWVVFGFLILFKSSLKLRILIFLGLFSVYFVLMKLLGLL